MPGLLVSVLVILLMQQAAAPAVKSPLLVLLGGQTTIWQNACHERGWQFLEPWSPLKAGSFDERVKALADKVREAETRLPVDPNRVYLAAQGDSVPALFYVAARIPDLWAAAVAAGGSPRAAIDSDRLFAANTTNLPVLWVFSEKDEAALGKKLESAGFNLDSQERPEVKPSEIFDWLADHERDPFPTTADYETGDRLFNHSYWVEITRFDPAEKNDVLGSTRVTPLGSGAILAAGPFAYNSADPGPGVLVTALPHNYTGPLKVNDRIVEMSGKALKNAAEFAQILYRTFDERPVVIMVQRGKERVRIETRIVVAPRPEQVTARVRAHFLPELHRIEVVSREVTQMKLTLPDFWLPATINWNGTDLAQAKTAGCWLLDEKKELLTASRCP